MEFDQIVRARHSVRKFKKDRVPEELIRSVLEAANSAPSAGNIQGYEIYVVGSEKKREELGQAAGYQESLVQAPVCLVFCANPERSAGEYGKRGRDLYSIQDATIAATFAVLKIIDLGLSTVWVGSFEEKEVKKIIRSDIYRPVALIPVGYADESPSPTSRRSLDSIVHYAD